MGEDFVAAFLREMGRTPLRRSQPMRRTRMASKPKPGSGIRPEQRDAVRLRDGHHCVRCGRSIVDFPASIHHRLMRSRGGSDNLANLVTLCGSGTTYCHGDVHSHVRQAEDDGWLCRSGETVPADVPMLTPDGWRYLADDGRVLTAAEWREGAPA